MATIKIQEQVIGEDNPTYFIADVAANWDSSLDRAKDLIHLAAEAGADAAKFQNFEADTIISSQSFQDMENKLSHQSSWEESVYEVYDKASLPVQWTKELRDTCNSAGIDYFTTPYSLDVVSSLKEYVIAWKLGSGDITWHEHIESMAKLDMPLFIATGASTMEEVIMAMEVAKKHTEKIVLMQCNTNYTASLENFQHISLNVLNNYSKQFPDVVLGLSDHTPGHTTVLGAVTLGARAVEKHFTDDTSRKGPDHKFSMDSATWREMVDRTRELEYALGTEEKRVMDNEKDSSIVQRRSIHVRRTINEGEVIELKDLTFLRPELPDSMPPYKTKLVVGKKALRTIKKNSYIKVSDV